MLPIGPGGPQSGFSTPRSVSRAFTNKKIGSAAFDSKWVPPVGGAPSRHTGTGGAADGVHAQCLRDSGAGDRSRVVPRSKQLGGAEWCPAMSRSKQLGRQPDEAMSSRASG
jgi:hypothetical protein